MDNDFQADAQKEANQNLLDQTQASIDSQTQSHDGESENSLPHNADEKINGTQTMEDGEITGTNETGNESEDTNILNQLTPNDKTKGVMDRMSKKHSDLEAENKELKATIKHLKSLTKDSDKELGENKLFLRSDHFPTEYKDVENEDGTKTRVKVVKGSISGTDPDGNGFTDNYELEADKIIDVTPEQYALLQPAVESYAKHETRGSH